MHLLSAQQVPAGAAEEGAVDLGQTPAEIVLLSAADTEIACLARAHARLGDAAPGLRLASLLRLGHPLSVDLYLDRVAAHARLVVVRLLGGRAYWTYGLDQLEALCRERGVLLACLPGDDRPDPELDARSTVPPEARARLWRYLVEGGVDNAEQCLRHAAGLVGRPLPWAEPRPLPRAGLYHPARPRLDLGGLLAGWTADRPRALLVFYRALAQSGDLAPIDALLAALDAAGLDAAGLFVASLKDREAAAQVEAVVAAASPDVVLNATAFAVGDPTADPLAAADAPVLQVVLASGGDEAAWRAGTRGLSPRDLAMSVALTELDGRLLARAVSFKALRARDPRTEADLAWHRPVLDRVAFTAALAAAWARLRRTPPPRRRVAVILANYPIRDGRLANGVGLDTPQSCVLLLRALADAGCSVAPFPADGDALIRLLAAGPTNDLATLREREVRASLPLDRYGTLLADLPRAVRDAVAVRWGPPEADPHLVGGAFALPVLPLGNVAVVVQPARGYHLDPAATYHAPDLVPPHAYLACYLWLRHVFGAHAVVQLGKHGNLEWLPGKATALSEACLPEAALGPLPHLYPFIVNDPGEGTQAKRRAAAVIVDHLTPPLTRAESHGALAELELLVDEYHAALALDPRRLDHLRREILGRSHALGLARDLGLEAAPDTEHLAALDGHLCELKELQIRDGLHVLGVSPDGGRLVDLLVALARLPRGRGEGADASLPRALARDLGLGAFDPLGADLGAPWPGPRPAALAGDGAWRTAGDTVERLEGLARALVAGERRPQRGWAATAAVLGWIEGTLRPAVLACGPAETEGVLRGLAGRRVAPGPSGAPSRGRPDVLPTGRNFYSVDVRAVPTPAAWHLGWRSAQLVVAHHLQTEGCHPRRVALSAWGTANMRTGGDDVAQALALLGCRPTWDAASGRVTGVEVLPLGVLDRPRVDVTLRVSGFFRDAFPAQLELLDDAVRAVAALDESEEENPLAAAARAERDRLLADGLPPGPAWRRATTRLFGSRPGAYGAGLQALIDGGGWRGDADLAGAYLAWGGFAYGRGQEGGSARDALARRLAGVELVLHNQDNREHDLLDSDDYYQFEGGLAAAVRHAAGGRQPAIYHNDHSRPESPRVRTLKDEIGRVVRARATNPKWIRGVMRHGYKGAFEIAATVDYLFAFAATARAVEDHHFDALYGAYLGDPAVRGFLAERNPAALREIADRFAEAIDRGLWRPRLNSAPETLDGLRAAAR